MHYSFVEKTVRVIYRVTPYGVGTAITGALLVAWAIIDNDVSALDISPVKHVGYATAVAESSGTFGYTTGTIIGTTLI